MAIDAAARKSGRGRRRLRRLGLAAAAAAPFLVAPMLHFDFAADGDSVCHGTPEDGWLDGADRPSTFGRNYRPYCYLCLLGLRTYGHAGMVAAIEDAYAAMAEFRPEMRFVYGEIGFPWGGWFYPHRTHRNGLAADFLTPMQPSPANPTGEPPTSLLNRFGYGLRLNADGVDLETGAQADFDAMRRHLSALDANARARGGRVDVVILAPDLQDDLMAGRGGETLSHLFRFNTAPSSVRHDNHYHVVFDFPCAAD